MNADDVDMRAPQTTGTSIKVIGCVHREALSSVFHSQVLVPLSLHEADIDALIIAHVPLGHLCRPRWRAQLGRMAKRCAARGVPVKWLPSPPARLRWMLNDAGPA